MFLGSFENITLFLELIKKRLTKSTSCSEILFLSIFKTLLGILYGPVDLLISREEKINLISSLLVGERRNELGFLFVI